MDNSSATSSRPLAVVTGASSGIGLELALLCAQNGYDLVIAADQGPLEEAAERMRGAGATVETVQTDLSTTVGVTDLENAIRGRPVDALLANAGHGLGKAFMDQDFEAVLHVINTNVIGTLDLVHRVGRGMRDRNSGKIMFTGSIAGLMPGSFQAVYNGTKAFIDSFSYALRNELKDTAVSVTVLMPGATATHFFERADLMDTAVGADDKKDAPKDVAQEGFDAMQKGDAAVVAGWKNKVQAWLTNIVPDEMLAEQHRKTAQPGTAEKA